MSENLPFMLVKLTITCKREKAEIVQHVSCGLSTHNKHDDDDDDDDIGLYAGLDAQFQLNTLSDGNAIDAIPLPLL